MFFSKLTMARPSKRRAVLRSSIAEARLERRRQLATDRRRDVLYNTRKKQVDYMFSLKDMIGNDRGRIRTFEENRVTLLAMIAMMQLWLEMVDKGALDVLDWTWSHFDMIFSRAMKQKQQHIRSLRTHYAEHQEVLVFGEEKGEDSLRGKASKNYKESRILTDQQCQWIIKYVDDEHAEGRSVNNTNLRSALFTEFDLELSRQTTANYLKLLGLSWKKAKGRSRKFGDYRSDAIRSYLIGLSKYKKDDNCVFVYTDESYVHSSHCAGNSYLGDGKVLNKSNSKGRRLIILHAITKDGPLCERVDGYPIDDLIWKGDTPHPVDRDDGLLTAECLWLANSNSGDYHDNMCSDMFLQWVERKLIPTFERLYPNKQMVLVADNAPYHHKRVVGSLGSLSKKELVDLCVKYEFEYLDLPLNDRRYQFYEDDDVEGVVDVGAAYRVDFEEETFLKSARASNPFIPTKRELQLSMVEYMKDHLPHLLECKVEKIMKERGHHILWTPPYCPQLQPIELFWACGKNFVADSHYGGRTMKETVKHLRYGWYGNKHLFDVPIDTPTNMYPPFVMEGRSKIRFRNPVNCESLVKTALKYANGKFMALADGISGTIDDLVIDEGYESNAKDVPVDLLLIDLSEGENASEPVDVDTI